jgi:hypothetical protein
VRIATQSGPTGLLSSRITVELVHVVDRPVRERAVDDDRRPEPAVSTSIGVPSLDVINLMAIRLPRW